MKPTIQYIQFQMPLSIAKNPLVYFITEHFESPQIMVYSDFVKYLLQNFNINDRKEIVKQLDSYQNVFLDNLTGEFQVIKDEVTNRKPSHNEMLKLNQEKKIENWVDKGLNMLKTKVSEWNKNNANRTNRNRF